VLLLLLLLLVVACWLLLLELVPMPLGLDVVVRITVVGIAAVVRTIGVITGDSAVVVLLVLLLLLSLKQ